MNNKPISVKTIVSAALIGIIGIGCAAIVDMETVGGSEIGVKENWNGIIPDPLYPGTYVRNVVTTKIFRYDMTSQVFAMNDTPSGQESGKGRDYDPYLVQSQDQQDMHINLSIRWRYDPESIVSIHKNYHSHIKASDPNIIEERLLRNTDQLVS